MALAFSVGSSQAADGALLPALAPDAQSLDPRWRNVGLPQATLPLTEFSATQLDGRLAVRVATHQSYSNLAHELAPPMLVQRLSWSWRVDQANGKSDLRTRSGDDVALRVCLIFDMALDKVPFVERQMQRLANAKVGRALPTATLCYAWDRALPRHTLLDNAYTRRLRLIVLRNERDGLGQWKAEQRDVAADFRRAFGEESTELPKVSAVFIGGDSDNTGVDTLGFVADLQAAP